MKLQFSTLFVVYWNNVVIARLEELQPKWREREREREQKKRNSTIIIGVSYGKQMAHTIFLCNFYLNEIIYVCVYIKCKYI